METQGRKHLFIIDDDKFLLDMYLIKFQERGFKVDTALSAADALNKMSEGMVPDVILLDIVMPEMDGFELLQKMKEKKLLGASTVVILSNLGQKEDIDRGLSLGADGYIVKAASTPTEVVNKVLEILKEKRDA